MQIINKEKRKGFVTSKNTANKKKIINTLKIKN